MLQFTYPEQIPSALVPGIKNDHSLIGKHENHGAGYGLEIPVNFKFFGPAKTIQWAENAVKKKLFEM